MFLFNIRLLALAKHTAKTTTFTQINMFKDIRDCLDLFFTKF